MKVWIVEYAYYDEVGFVGAYSTKKKAEQGVTKVLKRINKDNCYSKEELENKRLSYGIFEHKIDSEPTK